MPGKSKRVPLEIAQMDMLSLQMEVYYLRKTVTLQKEVIDIVRENATLDRQFGELCYTAYNESRRSYTALAKLVLPAN